LDGVYGFYAMTNYFAHKIEKVEDIKEQEEGETLVNSAKKAGVKHFVWATLPEIKQASGGKYVNVHHFDGKYHVEQYARKAGFEIDSYVAPSCYMQNFLGGATHVVFSLLLAT
jgi:NmrA-like family